MANSSGTLEVDGVLWQRLVRIAQLSAARTVRKEARFIARTVARCGGDQDLLREELNSFYAPHVELVMETMQLSRGDASTWCRAQVDEVLGSGIGAAETWINIKAAELSAIALR